MFDALFAQAIKDRVFPGAAWAVGRGSAFHSGFFGSETYFPDSYEVSAGTLWDLASLTKVICTTSLAMLVTDRDLLDIDGPVCSILPDFAANGKEAVRVRNLLAHDSGLAATGSFAGRPLSAAEILAEIDAAPLEYETGSKAVYSDLGFITLGRVLEVVGGESLDAQFAEYVAKPLDLHRAMFNPSPNLRPFCAPTEPVEPWRRALRGVANEELGPDGIYYVRGEAHDPTARMLGGVAGHAGLFARLEDLIVFIQAILARDPAPFKADTVRIFTKRTGEVSSRALGWDTNWRHESSAGSAWPETAFGHTGFTGTSIWADLETRAFAILLTNRVHPTAQKEGFQAFRMSFHDAAAKELA